MHITSSLCTSLSLSGGWGWTTCLLGDSGDACEAPSREHVVLVPTLHPVLLSDTLFSGSLCTPTQVLDESDLDNDNMLSFSEFEHAMAKSPDFMK